MAKVLFMENMNTICEHCGKPIKHAYVVTNDDIHYRVGTTCFKKYSNLNNASVTWLEKQFKDIRKMQSKQKLLEESLLSKDEKIMLNALNVNKIYWQYNYDNVLDSVNGWIKTYDSRIQNVHNEIEKKLAGKKILVS